MTRWLIHASIHGEQKHKFLDAGRVNENFSNLDECLSPTWHSSINWIRCGVGEIEPPIPPWPTQRMVRIISSLVYTYPRLRGRGVDFVSLLPESI